MHTIFINQQSHQLTPEATVAQALALCQAQPPFAVAVNTQFIPKSQYASHILHDQDHMDVISPVTGG